MADTGESRLTYLQGKQSIILTFEGVISVRKQFVIGAYLQHIDQHLRHYKEAEKEGMNDSD